MAKISDNALLALREHQEDVTQSIVTMIDESLEAEVIRVKTEISKGGKRCFTSVLKLDADLK
jgi:hypothetical protein